MIGEAARAFLADEAKTFVFPRTLPTVEAWLKDVPAAEQLEGRAGELLRRYLPHGAYMRVDLKPGHWLSYGYDAAGRYDVADRVPALFRESETLIAEGGAEVVGRYAAPRDLALSGLIWPEAVGYIAGTAYLVRQALGAGQLVLFANDPVFRGYSLGTQRLFMNAAILGPALK